MKNRIIRFTKHGGPDVLQIFNEEISHWNEYDYIVVNDDLNKCYDKIFNIIISEKNGARQKQNLNEIAQKVKELVG